MKSIYCLFIFLIAATAVSGQIKEQKKIKILLLGTVHFSPSKTDVYKNEALKATSSERQQQIEKVVTALARFKPDKIGIEMPVSKQAYADSLYKAYLKGNYVLQQNEIDQLGFQTAKGLNLPQLTCINYFGRFDTDSMNKFAQSNNQAVVLKDLDSHAKAFMNEISVKQKDLSLTDFLIYLNSQVALNKNLSLYTNYFVKVGKDTNYVGTDVTADWYNTNLHIYTNLLRQVAATDKAIVVIFGQGHIPILKHLFQSNPDFEVVEVKEVLR